MYSKIPEAADQHKMDIFIYELSMLNETCKLLEQKVESAILNNAVLESFLLHTRALKDFFENKRKYSDDLICSNFKDKRGNLSERQILSLDKNFKEALDKSLAHMTTTRLLYKPVWEPSLITLEVNRAALSFLSNYDPAEFPSEDKRIEYLNKFQ